MKIRTGFVSNSSSSSFIVIGNDISEIPHCDDQTFVIGPRGETEFGWESTTYDSVYDRINFAYLQTTYVNHERQQQWRDMLCRVIMEHTGASDVEIGLRGGYIDHQSAASEGENTEMFADDETLARFLFSGDSYIEGGNDNG